MVVYFREKGFEVVNESSFTLDRLTREMIKNKSFKKLAEKSEDTMNKITLRINKLTDVSICLIDKLINILNS